MADRRGYLLAMLMSSALLVALAACARDEQPPPTAPPLPTPDVPATVAAAVRDAVSALAPTPDAKAAIAAESDRREQVAAQVRATVAARPTQTPLPTHTPYPTPTPAPTATPTPTPAPTATPTPTPAPTATPTPTPAPTATPTPTPAPTATPTPTPAPRPDAQLAVTIDKVDGTAAGGEKLRIEFTITNESAEPAIDVSLAFRVNAPNKLLVARSDRGTCEESTCNLGSLDGYESISGHAVALVEYGFHTELRVESDVSWLLWNSNRRHAYAAASVPLTDDLPGGLIWVVPTNATGMACDDPVEVGPEAVYAGFGDKLYAVSKSSGEFLWVAEADDWMFQPILADGSIYTHVRATANGDYYIRSLDPSDGTLNWQHYVNAQVRGPAAVYDGLVFYAANGRVIGGRSEYSYLISLDAATGVENWGYRVEEWIGTYAVESGGNIYFGTYSGGDDYLYSIDPRSGELVRRYRTWGGSLYTPAVADGKAYIVSGYGYIYSMDLSTGEKDWEYLPKKGGVAGTPVLSDGNVYFRVYDREAEEFLSVHALDAATGGLKWQYASGAGLGPPTAADGSVYVHTRATVASLNALTGRPDWEAGYQTYCGPLTAADGVLYGRAIHNNRYLIFAIRAR